MLKKLLTILLLCLAAPVFNQTADAAEAVKEHGFISLSSSIVKEIEPNLASVVFAVENTAENAMKASSINNETSNKVIKALKALASNTDIIKTSNFSVRPVYANQGGKRVIKNYTAVNSVTVETKDINKMPKFIDAAISSGANRTNSLNYTIQNERAVCSEIYPELAKELAKTAAALASASGVSLDGLKQMNVSCNVEGAASNNVRFYAKALAASADGAAIEEAAAPVESGKIKIRAYVNADYYVK